MIRYLLGYSTFVCTANIVENGYSPDCLHIIGDCVEESKDARGSRSRFQRLNRTILPLLDRFDVYYHLECEVVLMGNSEEDFKPSHYNEAFRDQYRIVEKVRVVLYSKDDAFLVRLHTGTLPDAA